MKHKKAMMGKGVKWDVVLGPGWIRKKKQGNDSIKEEEPEARSHSNSPSSSKKGKKKSALRFQRVTDQQVVELFKEMEMAWDENNIAAFHR